MKGRWGNASLPFHDRRVRRFRDLGQGQLRTGGQDRRHAATRVRPRSIQTRARLRSATRRQSLLSSGSSDLRTPTHRSRLPEKTISSAKWSRSRRLRTRIASTKWSQDASQVWTEVTSNSTPGRPARPGLAAVWARENTREAIWDAMARKEVYATSGTRMLVRVFAGWDFEAADLDRSDFAEYGYQRGVPMGGDLSNAPAGGTPTLLVRAVRDVDGANLDRVQVIKGWLDEDGETQERIYDVAVSDGREIGRDGRSRTPVGNTVDVEEATYTNAIGDPYLTAYWEDPDFDPNQRAFYYVRVIEIPTPALDHVRRQCVRRRNPRRCADVRSRIAPIPPPSGTRPVN